MFSVNTDVTNLEALKNQLDFVEKMLKMKTDSAFQDFIKDKVLKLADKVTNERLIGGTTNDDAIAEYKKNHKIRDYEEGFILYNNTTIPANATDISGYENGFAVALAFEYGVGIVGQENTNNEHAWAYDVNNHGLSGWVFVYEDGSWERTRGYAGFEIYRHIAEEIKQNLTNWVKEYYKKEVK